MSIGPITHFGPCTLFGLCTFFGSCTLFAQENDATLGACEFGRFFQVTPPDLLNSGIYASLAIAFHDGSFRDVSAALLAVKLGAKRCARDRRRASIGLVQTARVAPNLPKRKASQRVLRWQMVDTAPTSLPSLPPPPLMPTRDPSPARSMLHRAGKAVAAVLKIGGFEMKKEDLSEASNVKERHSIDARSHRNPMLRKDSRQGTWTSLPTTRLSESTAASEGGSTRSNLGAGTSSDAMTEAPCILAPEKLLSWGDAPDVRPRSRGEALRRPVPPPPVEVPSQPVPPPPVEALSRPVPPPPAPQTKLARDKPAEHRLPPKLDSAHRPLPKLVSTPRAQARNNARTHRWAKLSEY